MRFRVAVAVFLITTLGLASAQPPDEIDAAFSSILSMLDKSADFGFANSFGSGLFPRVKRLGDKIERLVTILYDAALGDEANFLKQSFVDLGHQGGILGSGPPFFDSLPYSGDRLASGSERESLMKRIDDLDNLVSKYERQTTDFRAMSPKEREKVVEANRKAYNMLNMQHSKLLKKCYYTKTRIDFLLNELYEIRENKQNKNLNERLSVWKRFIENNEYVLNNQLSRSERDLLYAFLAKKLRETEPDIQQAEEIVFALV